MTPVEEIRRAAALMREQQGKFWDALADFIDRIAWTWEIDPDLQSRVGGDELLAVVRAYLAGVRP